VRAQLLDGSATSVRDTVRHLGFLQMDPIATVATPQELVLWSRLGPYDRSELDRLLESRKLIEWNAFIYPVEDLPILRALMRRPWGKAKWQQWQKTFLQEQTRLRAYVLRELERRGPIPSRELEHADAKYHERTTWWGTRAQLTWMLELLAIRGRIAVAGRDRGQRLWDLAERVYPDTDTLPLRDALALREEKRRRALGVWLERRVVHVHPEAEDGPVPKRTTLLSPFDRLIHDRKRAHALWDFFYRLEMYVPKAKREYGYYVLPVLHGDRIVGRIDPVFDRKSKVLTVNAIYPEDGVRFPYSGLQRALKSLARFLGAEEISVPRR